MTQAKVLDPDRDPIKFNWKKISADNLNIDLMNDRSSIASFVAPPIKSQTTMVFRLSVVDVNGNTDSDQIQVIVSKKTGKDKQEGQTLMGKPKLNNKEDNIDKSQGKLLGLSSVNKNQNTLTKSELKQGSLSDQSRKDSRVAGNQIKVNAGSDTEAFGGEIVTLGGKISTDLNSNQIKLSWKQTKGPTVHLSSNHIFNPLFVAPNVKKSEKIEFKLYASDQNGVVASDSVTIVVNPPSGKEANFGQRDKILGQLRSNQIMQALESAATTIRLNNLCSLQVHWMPPPTVVSPSATGAIGVAVTSTITATFGEAVQGLTVNPSTFTLKNMGGTSMAGIVTLSTDGRTAIFTPSSPLLSTSYTLP